MNWEDYSPFKSFVEIDEAQAERIRIGKPDWYPVRVYPPRESVPETIEETVRSVLEIQTKYFGTRNYSPPIAFEIHRHRTDRIRLQFLLPTKRLERKLRIHLANEAPGVGFENGTTEIPLAEGNTVGGGYLTTGIPDYYPLRTDFDEPPINSVVAALHRDAMRDTRFVIQVLARPVAGDPLRNWWWTRNAYKRIGFLKREDKGLWGDRPATPRERRQADAIEDKAGIPRFHVVIRLLVINADEYTTSRLKELKGGFNTFEDLETGQYLKQVSITSFRAKPFLQFCRNVVQRRFDGRTLRFQASIPEVAALVSIPNQTDQRNIKNADP